MKELDISRIYGSVLWFSPQKGFGFVAPDNGQSDIFCHFSHIVMEGYKTLEPGTRVSFQVGDNHRGPMAIDIHIENESK